MVNGVSISTAVCLKTVLFCLVSVLFISSNVTFSTLAADTFAIGIHINANAKQKHPNADAIAMNNCFTFAFIKNSLTSIYK